SVEHGPVVDARAAPGVPAVHAVAVGRVVAVVVVGVALAAVPARVDLCLASREGGEGARELRRRRTLGRGEGGGRRGWGGLLVCHAGEVEGSWLALPVRFGRFPLGWM
ncbi:hypothetical protein QBC33DRAFT_586654, partial [Phialemonium atrogriseum]